MFSEAENFCRNLHFLLLTETDGNGQLNISMQLLATSDGEKSLRICLAVSTEYWRVTDRQTDRQTDRHLAHHSRIMCSIAR